MHNFVNVTVAGGTLSTLFTSEQTCPDFFGHGDDGLLH
jgi:hypothetical protein